LRPALLSGPRRIDIMRRVLKARLLGQPEGDLTTLEQ
jgi:hypothetical protein